MQRHSGQSSKRRIDRCQAHLTKSRTKQHKCKHRNFGKGHGRHWWQAGVTEYGKCWGNRCWQAESAGWLSTLGVSWVLNPRN